MKNLQDTDNQQVRVLTPSGLVIGYKTRAYGDVKNQIFVKFLDGNNQRISGFSRKTGLPYMNQYLKDKGYKIIDK